MTTNTRVEYIMLIFLLPLAMAFPLNEDPPVPAKLVSSYCSFGDNQYKVGETWNPVLEPFGVQSCVNCTCGEDGGVTCKAPTCPPTDCDRPYKPAGQCCPTCDGNPPISNNLPVLGGPTIRKKKCRHDGNMYRHNQKFSSQKTALRPYKPNQCVQCVCLDGEVLCHLKSCPVLMCETRVYTSTDCCPVCSEGGGGVLPWQVWTTRRARKNNAHCKTGGVRYPHGTTWHPEVGDFGKMDCVVCTCLNSDITCKKLKCPSTDDLPCDKPRRQPGQCCKSCPNDVTPTVQAPSVPKKTNDSTDNVLHACPTGRSDTLVLKSKTSKLFTILFENLKTNTVEMFQWQLNKGRMYTFLVEEFSSEAFRETFSQQNHKYEIIGSTRKKYVLRFKRRTEKYMRRCRDHCTRKRVQNLVGRLRLTKVQYRPKC